MAPFLKMLQDAGCLPLHAEGPQETPQQKRRRLLQAAKTRAIEHYWPFTGTVTVDMRAEARLAIDRELRNEPLEDFTPQEVTELVEGLRDRIYTSYWHRQKKDARRIQEGNAHTRATQCDRTAPTERIRKKNAFLDEVRRRAAALLKTRPLSIVQRIHLLEDLLKHCDAAFTEMSRCQRRMPPLLPCFRPVLPSGMPKKLQRRRSNKRNGGKPE